MTRPVCVISGVGPGTGSAWPAGSPRRLSRRDAGAKSRASPSWSANSPEAKATPATCRMRRKSRQRRPDRTRARRANRSVHNAVGGAFGSFLEIDPAVLDRNFQVNTMGLLYLARRLTPEMVKTGRGNIIVTGNTSALRGKPLFAGFAPTKAAQRILSEAMARELGPKGVHVAYTIIDAVIDVPGRASASPTSPTSFSLSPPPSPKRRGI